MNDFVCFSCRRTKKNSLIGEIRPNKQKICTACLAAKEEARLNLMKEYNIKK